MSGWRVAAARWTTLCSRAERQSDPEEVRITITARLIDEHVGLIANAFSISFALLGVGQAVQALASIPQEERSYIYLIRLAAFTLLVAIFRENRSSGRTGVGLTIAGINNQELLGLLLMASNGRFRALAITTGPAAFGQHQT